MDTAKRHRYLNALGITVWRSNTANDVEVSAAEPLIDKTQDQPDPLDAALERAIQAPAPVLADLPPVQKPPVAADPQPAMVATSAMDWNQLQSAASSCTQCPLCEDRQQAVFDAGVRTADLMVIGEAPGEEEDQQGQSFVGPAGQLLDKMLAAINYSRSPKGDQQSVYITNVVKCRPPKDRDPKKDEAAACRGYLDRQIALSQPRLVMAFGRTAAQNLLGSGDKLGELREGFHEYRMPDSEVIIPVLVTYHPGYLLRTPSDKGKAWEDLKRARQVLTVTS